MKPITNHLLFGAAYYLEYLPYDRLEKDMTMMEKAGMNTIRIAESTWSTLEPQDDVYDFTAIDRVLEAASRHHISVIIGTPTYAIPTWLVKKYPDILAITKNGPERYGHRQNMDITHPMYRFHAERIIRKLMEHIRNVPHIIGFQLDNETKSYGTAGERVQQMFVSYLQEKYPDIDEFNREFGLDYWSNRVNNWEDFPDVCGTINQSLDAEFRRFQRSLVTEFLSWQAAIVSEYKRDDQFITQNFDFAWTGHSFGYQPEVNQYEAAKCMTIAGADIYHPSGADLTGAEISVCGNISRSLKKNNYLILETEAQGLTPWLPYPGQMRLQAYAHIANGADSVMYWHWHSIHNAIESYWKGVLSHDFSENATYREACQIGEEWKRIGSHLLHLKKENHVAVMLDNLSLTGLSEFPLETTGDNSYNSVLRWITNTLYRMNIEFDMISSTERDFSSYEFLFVPALYAASKELLESLDQYTKNGGHLIMTFRSAFADEQLKIYHDTQPHSLTKCIGAHYDQFTYPKNMSIVTKDGQHSSVHDWMELVIPDTATVLAHYDHPFWGEYAAITKYDYGNGCALYLGAFFDDTLLASILLDFIDEYSENIIPAVDCKSNKTSHANETTHANKIRSMTQDDILHFPIIRKCGVNTLGHNICYYFNFSSEAQSFLYEGDDAVELLTEKQIMKHAEITLAPWDLVILENE